MFASHHMLTQKPEKYLADAPLFNRDIPVWQSPLCAWCLSEQGLLAGEESHGICSTHANRLLLQQRTLRRRRIVTGA
jgi:hypothetical protein